MLVGEEAEQFFDGIGMQSDLALSSAVCTQSRGKAQGHFWFFLVVHLVQSSRSLDLADEYFCQYNWSGACLQVFFRLPSISKRSNSKTVTICCLNASIGCLEGAIFRLEPQ